MKDKKKDGIIIIASAVVFFAIALVCELLGVFPLTWQEIAVSAALLLYGLLLVFVRIKGYGWGISAIVGIITTVKYIIEFDLSIVLASVVTLESIAMLILSNVIKSNKQ